MSRYGNTSVSALLSQARSALKKQQAYEEEIASYEYDLSNKDQEAYNKYASFLTKRANEVKTSDPTKALSLQRALTGANRSFTSSEIQRASINILEGNSSKQDKLQTLIGLYRRALENGDEATAQRIQLQADTLQQSIFSEQNAARGGGGGGGGSSRKSYDQVQAENLIAQRKNELDYLVNAIKTGGNKALGDIEKTGGGKTFFGTTKGIIEDIIKTYQDLAANEDDPGKKQGYLEKAQEASQKRYDIGFGQGKSLEDINKFIQARAVGGNVTSLQNNIDGTFKFKENPIAGTMYIKGENGLPQLANKYAGGSDTQYGEYLKAAQERLKSKGISSKSGSDGVISFYNPVTGQTVEGTADQYGNVLYRGLDDNGNTLIRRFVTGEGKDEVVSQQEQEAILNAGNATDTNSNRLVRDQFGTLAFNAQQIPGQVQGIADQAQNNQYVKPVLDALGTPVGNIVKGGVKTVAGALGGFAGAVNTIDDAGRLLGGVKDVYDNTIGDTVDKVVGTANTNKRITEITKLAGSIGAGNPFANTAGFVGTGVGALGQIGNVGKYIQGLKVKHDQEVAAQAAREEAAYRANLNAIQQANAVTAARQVQANRGLPVITPTITNPTPQAQVIGSRDFNKTYLGGYGDLLNKYTR